MYRRVQKHGQYYSLIDTLSTTKHVPILLKTNKDVTKTDQSLQNSKQSIYTGCAGKYALNFSQCEMQICNLSIY